MRKEPTPGEARLWVRLRRRQLGGLRFRRQVVIDYWIVDFACLERRVIVEVDGSSHDGRAHADAQRDAQLAARGFTVFRVTEHEVLTEMDAVLAGILARLSP